MGDELVAEVLASLADVAFANGKSLNDLHPYVDALVNKMREGIADDDIRALLLPRPEFGDEDLGDDDLAKLRDAPPRKRNLTV